MADVVAYGLLPVFLVLLVASAASLFLRYRRAAPAERLQLRWMAVAAMTIPLTLLLCWASYLALGTADLVVVGLAAMYVAVPVATAIALVRSTWFDVDELLVRTTVYAVLAGVVLAAIAVVSGLAGVLAARESVVVAVSVTVLTLIILLPLRRRLNTTVAALVFPHRERTLRAVSELQRDVHAGVRAPEELEATLRAALEDPGLRVGYRIPGRTAFVDAAGDPVEPRRPPPTRRRRRHRAGRRPDRAGGRHRAARRLDRRAVPGGRTAGRDRPAPAGDGPGAAAGGGQPAAAGAGPGRGAGPAGA